MTEVESDILFSSKASICSIKYMYKSWLSRLSQCALAGSIATLVFIAPSTAQTQSEEALVTFLNGAWEGTYTCRQGLTNLRLDIQASDATDIDVVFAFSGHPTNPRNPSGSFRMQGDYEISNSANIPSILRLDATSWLRRPSGYSTVDLQGTVSGSRRTITGNVRSPGCSTFEVTKLDAQNAVHPETSTQNSLQSTPDSQDVAQTNRDSQLDGPESVVSGFHQAIQDGKFDTLDTYFCSVERISAQGLERGVDPNGRNRSLLNAYLQIADTIYSVDMSMLQYETVYTDDEGEGRAVVTVAGSVAVESANGQGILVPYQNFSTLGRAWLRLIKENGQWKLCQNLEA